MDIGRQISIDRYWLPTLVAMVFNRAMVPLDELALYCHLARANELRRQPLQRDRLLVICGAMAAQLELPRIATVCRNRILEHNPGHLLHRYESFEEALADEDFHVFLRQIRRRYPVETVERLLSEFGVVVANERDAYYTDEEFLASLLAATRDEIVGE